MEIIETLEEFEAFLPTFQSHESLIIPFFVNPKAHPAMNTLSVLFISISDKWYTLVFDHVDGLKLPLQCLERLQTEYIVYTPSKKVLWHLCSPSTFINDIQGKEYLITGDITDPQTFLPPTMRMMYAQFSRLEYVNRCIPLMQVVRYMDKYRAHLKKYLSPDVNSPPGFGFLNEVVICATQFMEHGGVYVDVEKFVKRFGENSRNYLKNGIFYTEYNPYTTTGRVTSRFAGINTSALNKTDRTREMFVSRFGKDGFITLIDFESFHLRLIAEMIGFHLPRSSAHKFLGKQYFGVEDLTPDQYEEAKKITFAYLYGQQKAEGIPFFEAVEKYIDEMWWTINKQGRILVKDQKRPHLTSREIRLDRIETPNPQKVFNYYLQWMETQVVMNVIGDLIPLFGKSKSKIPLYTYDSLMIDFNTGDGIELLQETVNVLEQGGKYPVRIYIGSNYQELQNVTERFIKTD